MVAALLSESSSLNVHTDVAMVKNGKHMVFCTLYRTGLVIDVMSALELFNIDDTTFRQVFLELRDRSRQEKSLHDPRGDRFVDYKQIVPVLQECLHRPLTDNELTLLSVQLIRCLRGIRTSITQERQAAYETSLKRKRELEDAFGMSGNNMEAPVNIFRYRQLPEEPAAKMQRVDDILPLPMLPPSSPLVSFDSSLQCDS